MGSCCFVLLLLSSRTSASAHGLVLLVVQSLLCSMLLLSCGRLGCCSCHCGLACVLFILLLLILSWQVSASAHGINRFLVCLCRALTESRSWVYFDMVCSSSAAALSTQEIGVSLCDMVLCIFRIALEWGHNRMAWSPSRAKKRNLDWQPLS